MHASSHISFANLVVGSRTIVLGLLSSRDPVLKRTLRFPLLGSYISMSFSSASLQYNFLVTQSQAIPSVVYVEVQLILSFIAHSGSVLNIDLRNHLKH